MPTPLAIQAPWRRWHPAEPLRFRLVLLGRAACEREALTGALQDALPQGVGASRVPLHLARAEWRSRSLADAAGGNAGETDGARVTLDLLSPLRLVRKGTERERFCLDDLVRDLNFRVAVWGHYHQGLSWAPPWAFLREDAARCRVVDEDVRLARFRRYSGRQRRAIPLRGLLGRVELESVSARLLSLLRAGEVSGCGKGTSIGLGCIRVRVSAEEW
jgi:hypothetical protein